MYWTDQRTYVRTDRPTDCPRQSLTTIGRCATRETRPKMREVRETVTERPDNTFKCHPAMKSFVSMQPDNSLVIQSCRTSLGRRRPGVVGATLYTTDLVTVLTQRTHSPLYVTGTRSCKWTGLTVPELPGSRSTICYFHLRIHSKMLFKVVQLWLYSKKITTTTTTEPRWLKKGRIWSSSYNQIKSAIR